MKPSIIFSRQSWVPTIAWVWVALAGSVVFWLVVYHQSGSSLSPWSDTWDYAHLGRESINTSVGNSLFTYPVLLEWGTEPPFPLLWRLPGYPLVCAVPFLFADDVPIQTFVYLSGLFLILAVMVAIVWGMQFMPPADGILWGLLLILFPSLLGVSFKGLSEPFYLLMLLLFVWRLERGNRFSDFSAGILLGILYLTRSNTLFLFPGIMLWVFLRQTNKTDGLLRVLGIFLPAGLVCLPWWWRNAVLTGDPMYLLTSRLVWMFSDHWPGFTLFRTYPPPELDWSWGALSSVIKKTLWNLWFVGIRQRFVSLNPVMLGLCLVALVCSYRDRVKSPRIWHLCLALLLTDAVTILGLAVFNPDFRLYLPMVPFLFLGAVIGLRMIREHWHPLISRSVMVVVVVSVLAYQIRFWNRVEAEPVFPLLAAEQQTLAASLPEGAFVLSDAPGALAWDVGLYGLFLPTSDSLPSVLEAKGGECLLFLSPHYSVLLSGEGDADQSGWTLVLENQDPLVEIQPLWESPRGHRLLQLALR